MEQNTAVGILLKNFHKLCDSHLETLRFITAELYKLFDSVITISVAITGIIIPIILTSGIAVQ